MTIKILKKCSGKIFLQAFNENKFTPDEEFCLRIYFMKNNAMLSYLSYICIEFFFNNFKQSYFLKLFLGKLLWSLLKYCTQNNLNIYMTLLYACNIKQILGF